MSTTTSLTLALMAAISAPDPNRDGPDCVTQVAARQLPFFRPPTSNMLPSGFCAVVPRVTPRIQVGQFGTVILFAEWGPAPSSERRPPPAPRCDSQSTHSARTGNA